ncbi:MAG: 2Fe-2S iron-sulfur cluster-binding protein [Rhizomicrobium sp.]
MKIIATDRVGATREIEGRDGWSVMEILRDAGLPIAAECGGACACATCHVYVTDGCTKSSPRPPTPRSTCWTWRCGRADLAPLLPDRLRRRAGRNQSYRCTGINYRLTIINFCAPSPANTGDGHGGQRSF